MHPPRRLWGQAEDEELSFANPRTPFLGRKTPLRRAHLQSWKGSAQLEPGNGVQIGGLNRASSAASWDAWGFIQRAQNGRA